MQGSFICHHGFLDHLFMLNLQLQTVFSFQVPLDDIVRNFQKRSNYFTSDTFNAEIHGQPP